MNDRFLILFFVVTLVAAYFWQKSQDTGLDLPDLPEIPDFPISLDSADESNSPAEIADGEEPSVLEPTIDSSIDGLLTRLDASGCEFEAGARIAENIVERLEALAVDRVRGRSLEDWRRMTANYQAAINASGEEQAFEAFWLNIGGELSLFESTDLARDLASGKPGALDQLRRDFPDSVEGMLLFAVDTAVTAGRMQVAEDLFAHIEYSKLKDHYQGSYLAALIQMGRVDEAETLLAAFGESEKEMSLGSGPGGILLVYFIEKHGLEPGFTEMKAVLGQSALVSGLFGAMHVHRKAGNGDRLSELLGARAVGPIMSSAAGTSASLLASVIVVMDEVLGEQAALQAVASVTEAIQGDTFWLPAFVAMLARQGCSDACLAIPVEAVREAARGGDQRWQKSLRDTLAATGELASLSWNSGDVPELFAAAREFAVGRQDVSYVQPLIDDLGTGMADPLLAQLVMGLIYADAELPVIDEALSLSPGIVNIGPWNTVVGAVKYYENLDDATRKAIRELLIRRSVGGCHA